MTSVLLVLTLAQAAPAGTGRLAGRITAAGTNAPVAGARVIIVPAGRMSTLTGPPPQALTDQDGRFVFEKLAPGEYRLDVQKTGFAPLFDFAAQMDPAARPRTVTVVAGQALDHVDVQLQKGGVISGRLLDSSGEPMTEARVMALRRTPSRNPAIPTRFMPAPMQGPQQTNDLGEFRVTGLAAGDYYIAAAPQGMMRFGGASVTTTGGGSRTTPTTTFYPGTTDEAGAQMITVAAGAEVGNIVFTMQSAPAYVVSGVVVDDTGAPVEHAMVMLMRDPRNGTMFMGPAGNVQTQAGGRFVISDVTSGTYRVSATVMNVNPGGIGAVTGGTFMSFSTSPIGGVSQQPAEVVVADADVRGLRVVARRPQ